MDHSLIINGVRVTKDMIEDLPLPGNKDGAPDFEYIAKMLPTDRSCGDCDLCCTALEIFEMDKPAGMRCPMMRPSVKSGGPGGCGIYGQHPRSCQGYVCLWRASDDFVPRAWLPSKVGWLLSWDPFVNPHCVTVFIDPDRPNAWRQAHFVRFFKKVARDANVLVIIGGGGSAFASISPNGSMYDKQSNPDYFLGAQVGVPGEDFRAGGSEMFLPGAGLVLTEDEEK